MSRGVFPYQLSWMLELPWRRIVLSPEHLLSRLPIRPDPSVLELGAGSGYYTTAVAMRALRGHVAVLDVQPEMLERCRRRCTSAEVTNVSYTAGDAAALPFGDARFDLVYMVTVFGEVRDQEGCLRDIRRVLRPNGMLSISEHLPDPDFTPLDALQQRAERAGFVLRQRHGSRWAYTADFDVAP